MGFNEAMEKQRDRRQGEGGQVVRRLGSLYREFMNINRGGGGGFFFFFFFFFFSFPTPSKDPKNFLMLGTYDLKSGSPVWGVTGSVVLLCLYKMF